MEQYSDELVELGNQAWILNCALAELDRFRGCLGPALQAESTAALRQGADAYLAPAVDRLSTRLQALMTKWTRRMVESGVDAAPPQVRETPWGCEVALPAQVAARWQVEREAMRLAEAQALAAREPESFVLFYPQAADSRAVALEADTPLQVIRISGVPLNVARMWWAWGIPGPVCRLQALSANLWQIDRCGGLGD